MKIWYDGENNYRLMSLFGNLFTTELLDVPTTDRTVNQVFYDNLANRQTKVVDVLYSGGLDSECVLSSCLINKIPVRAVTMRLLVNNCPINTHDLYYSEKFCREHDVDQVLVDLDVVQFFESGRYLDYLVDYRIDEPHVATHFWLLEQCRGFPVIGGDYTWPHQSKDKISPHRLSYSCYNRFMRDRGISGIGNMLGHSLDTNVMFMNEHLKVHEPDMVNKTKRKVFENLGLGTFELRYRSYGWEQAHAFNKTYFKIELSKQVGLIKNRIIWNNVVGSVLNGPGSNDSFK